MPHYQIDVWQDQSIWSWAGKVENEDDACEAARLQLNEDWEEDYETWDDLAADMDGTALLYDVRADALEDFRDFIDTVAAGNTDPDRLADMAAALLTKHPA